METEDELTQRQGYPVRDTAVNGGIAGHAGYVGRPHRSAEAIYALRIVVTDALLCGVSLDALERAIKTVRAHMEQEAKA